LGMNKSKATLLVGSYAGAAPNLYRCTFDPVSGALHLNDTLTGPVHPSFFIQHTTGDWLYAATGLQQGTITAYRMDPNGGLTEINRQPVNGHFPCYMSCNPDGSALFVANYRSGNVALLPIQNDGSLGAVSDVTFHTGSGPVSNRQNEPHPHSVIRHPVGPYVVVADLGIDRLILYEGGPGQKLLKKVAVISLRSGMGPRHLTFHPTLPILYVMGELDNTVSVLSFSCDGLTFKEIQHVSTLPSDYEGISYGADIHVTSCGTFLFGSNRGHDSIVVFRIDPTDGTLTAPYFTHSGGKTPVAFTVTSDNRFLIVINKDSDSIVSFEIDPYAGELKQVSKLSEVLKPACIWLNKEEKRDGAGFC